MTTDNIVQTEETVYSANSRRWPSETSSSVGSSRRRHRVPVESPSDGRSSLVRLLWSPFTKCKELAKDVIMVNRFRRNIAKLRGLQEQLAKAEDLAEAWQVMEKVADRMQLHWLKLQIVEKGRTIREIKWNRDPQVLKMANPLVMRLSGTEPGGRIQACWEIAVAHKIETLCGYHRIKLVEDFIRDDAWSDLLARIEHKTIAKAGC